MLPAFTKFPLFKSLLPNLTTRYDHAAKGWHKTIYKLGYFQAYKDLILTAFDAPSHNKPADSKDDGTYSVLDAGCGSGAFSMALCQSTPRPMSIDLLDISSKMLTQAAQNLSDQPHIFRQICAGIESINFQSQKYDLILSAHVIDHLDQPDIALKSFHDALRPNGKLLLAVSKPHWCTSLVQMRWHHNAYQPADVTQMLKNAGFQRITQFLFKEGPPKFTSHGYTAQK